MKRRFLLSSLLLLALFLPLQAQERYRWFHHLQVTPDDVRTVCPEASGRVWFGTSRGLFRYGDSPDGAHYDRLPAVFQQGVNEIYPFDAGQMLVRIRDGSFWVYNPADNAVESFAELLSSWGLDVRQDQDLRIRADGTEALWMCWENRLYRKRLGEGEFVLVAELPGTIRSMDSAGDAFCAVTDSLLYISSLSAPDGARTVAHGIKFNQSGVWCALDGEGNVWVGREGLYRFPKETLQGETISDNILVIDMLRNQAGSVVVGTGVSGIFSYTPDGVLYQHANHRTYESGTLGSNNIRSIHEGPDGALWVCHGKPSVSVSLPGSMAAPSRHILPLLYEGLEENVISIAQAPDGKIWFGTDGQGLFCLDRIRNGDFSVPAVSLSQPAVTALFFDSHGRTWIGTYQGGIYCVEEGRVRHLLPSLSGYCFLEDSRGDIWVGTQGNGVFRIPGNLSGDPVPADMKGWLWVFSLAELDGTIYAATSNGLVSLQPGNPKGVRLEGTRSGKQRFVNNYFSSVVRDSRNLLWLSGGRGNCPLEIFDPVRDTILYLPQLDGRGVRSIVEDADRNIWLAAENNFFQIIVNFDPKSQQYQFHPSEYSFRSQELVESFNNSRAVSRLADGTLLFGGTAGYRQVQPSEFPPRTSLPDPPVLSIATIRVNGEYVWLTGQSSQECVTLPHDRNNVSLVISSQNYASPFETALLYRIRNIDPAWKTVRGNIIDLDRLVPGRYDVEICNSFPDGSIAGVPVPFSIEIKDPWYETWWAWLIYALLGASAILLAIRYYRNHLQKEASLEQIRQEAERQHQLNEMKLRFFTNVSHDFRTPLSLIITPLETRLEAGTHKEEEAFLKPVYRNAVRLLGLVNQILDFRKLEADGIRLNFTYGNLVPFLKDVCASFTLFADEKSIRLDFLPQREEILTAFDKDKISKTVMNLLSNAFKFTPQGGRVTVRVWEEDGHDLISVADTGPGIPDSQKQAVFERFYQYHDKDSTYIGTGLGLHIVKEFVELHEGTVTLTDNTPVGSIFTVSLPVRGKEEATRQESSEPAGEPVEAPVSPEGKKILLVEDNADFRDFVSGQLSDSFTVLTAEDGRSALKVLAKEDVDLIISDIMMEGMDGLELCKAVKSNINTSHIPFILLTAKALAEDEVLGLEYGADDYVTKPFHMRILRLRIQKLLDAHIMAQQTFREKLEVNPSEITITSLDEKFLEKAIRLTEDNMADTTFSVEKLSSILGMHRTHLYKKLLSITGKTPVEFIRTIRLKRAAQYLLKSQLYISEIAYEVGFNSPKLFSRHFRSEFGMTPREYQRKHGIGPSSEEEEDLDET